MLLRSTCLRICRQVPDTQCAVLAAAARLRAVDNSSHQMQLYELSQSSFYVSEAIL